MTAQQLITDHLDIWTSAIKTKNKLSAPGAPNKSSLSASNKSSSPSAFIGEPAAQLDPRPRQLHSGMTFVRGNDNSEGDAK